jgi:PAB1-binding protein PBP1
MWVASELERARAVSHDERALQRASTSGSESLTRMDAAATHAPNRAAVMPTLMPEASAKPSPDINKLAIARVSMREAL